jgi:hypothetical protein
LAHRKNQKTSLTIKDDPKINIELTMESNQNGKYPRLKSRKKLCIKNEKIKIKTKN